MTELCRAGVPDDEGRNRGEINLDSVALKACNDCEAEPGQAHEEGCTVARCMAYGNQRVLCQPGARIVVRGILPNGGVDVDWEEDGHDCGRDVWSGRWPGTAECEEFGWWAYFVPNGNPSWQRCAPGHPGASPDLNRLQIEAKWEPSLGRWVRP